jgi:hypothetical protein
MSDEISNLNIIIVALKIVVSYDILHLEENYQGTCFGDAFLRLVNMLQQMKKFVKT